MRVILPNTIAEADLIAASVAEPSAGETAWVPGAGYSIGDLRIRTETHRVYRAITAHSGLTTPPESDTDNWLDLEPTNRWRPFDTQTSTRAVASASLSYTLASGNATAVGLSGIEGATEAAVTLTVDSVEVYSRTVSLLRPVYTWPDWLYSPPELRTAALIDGIPPYLDGELTVTLTGPGEVGLGALVAGRVATIGGTRYDLRLGISDWSRIDTDPDFGTVTLVRRGWAKAHQFPVWLRTTEIDAVYAMLADLRATPTVWAGSRQRYNSMTLFGVYGDFDIVVPGPAVSLCSLTLKELS